MEKFNSDGVKIRSQIGGGGGGGITNINVSAGTTSQNLSNIVFSNSNKLSFGLNGSTITAIVSGINAFGATNTGNTLGNTGVSTGIDWVIAGTNNVTVSESTVAGGPNTLWLSAAGGGGGASVNFSAGTTSGDLNSVVFSNSNGISFGLNGSTITASHNGLTNIRLSAGTTSNLRSDFTFSNSNGVSFGLDAGTITASIATSLTNIRVSAGTTSNLLSAITFSNSNGISFGLDASTITASHNGITSQTNQQMTLFATGNTTLSSSGTSNASSLIFRGSNAASVGITNGSILIDVAAGGGGGARTLSLYANNEGAMGQSINVDHANAFLYVRPLGIGHIFPGVMTVSSMFFNITGTVSTGAPWTRSIRLGFYTMVNSTQISLAFSAETTFGTNAANAGINNSVAGNRWLTFHSSQFNVTPTFSQTHYWFAIWQRSSSGSQSFSILGSSLFALIAPQSGFMMSGSTNNVSRKWWPFLGITTNSFTTAMPDSIPASGLNNSVLALQQMPQFFFNNVGSDIV